LVGWFEKNEIKKSWLESEQLKLRRRIREILCSRWIEKWMIIDLGENESGNGFNCDVPLKCI